MAFRIKPTESVSHGIRRLAARELKGARAELNRRPPPGDTAVHEARKHVKKAHALLELVDADHGHGTGGAAKRLRRVNRTLSGLRDADAMVATLDTLRKRAPRLLSEHTYGRLRSRLLAHKHEAMQAAERDGMWKDVDRELGQLRAGAKTWRPVHARFGAIEPGLRAAHKRGRKAMVRARTQRTPEHFHAWRKAMKALWYALRLAACGGRSIERDIVALHRAERLLGDDHNMAMLCGELSKDPSLRAGEKGGERLRAAADRLRAEWRRKAIGATQYIYGRKPRRYARAVKQAWKAARRRGAVAPARRRPAAA